MYLPPNYGVWLVTLGNCYDDHFCSRFSCITKEVDLPPAIDSDSCQKESATYRQSTISP